MIAAGERKPDELPPPGADPEEDEDGEEDGVADTQGAGGVSSVPVLWYVASGRPC